MNEWILVLTMSIASQPGEIRDVSPSFISGFKTKQTCEAAASQVAEKLIYQVGKVRESQSITSTKINFPRIWYDCIQITK